MEQNPDVTNPRLYHENISFPGPLAIRYMRVPLYRFLFKVWKSHLILYRESPTSRFENDMHISELESRLYSQTLA